MSAPKPSPFYSLGMQLVVDLVQDCKFVVGIGLMLKNDGLNELVKAHCFFLLSGVDYFHCYITKFDLVCQEIKSFITLKRK